jgi:hypothetical protein
VSEGFGPNSQCFNKEIEPRMDRMDADEFGWEQSIGTHVAGESELPAEQNLRFITKPKSGNPIKVSI